MIALPGPAEPTGTHHKDGTLVEEQEGGGHLVHQEQLPRLVPGLHLHQHHHAAAFVQHVLHPEGVGEGAGGRQRPQDPHVLLAVQHLGTDAGRGGTCVRSMLSPGTPPVTRASVPLIAGMTPKVGRTANMSWSS